MAVSEDVLFHLLPNVFSRGESASAPKPLPGGTVEVGRNVHSALLASVCFYRKHVTMLKEVAF